MGGVISSITSSSSGATLKVSFFMLLGRGVFSLVDCTPCEDLTMCPLIVSTECGQLFSAFEYVSPDHVSKLPFFTALSHMYLTGNPDAAWMYRTSASTLGISYALYDEVVVCIFGMWCITNSSVGFKAKRHSLGSYFSLNPVRFGLLPGDKI